MHNPGLSYCFIIARYGIRRKTVTYPLIFEKRPVEKARANHIDIPKIFYSDATGGYLERCIGCDLELCSGDTDYLIEKAFKSYQGLESYSTIFEYAMCLTCVDRMHQTLSEESRANISSYFQKHAKFPNWVASGQADNDINQQLSCCILTAEKAHEIPEFQIYGHCRGKELIVSGYPFMISGKAMDMLVELISDQTLDELQNFTDQLVGGPSEFADILKLGPRLIF